MNSIIQIFGVLQLDLEIEKFRISNYSPDLETASMYVCFAGRFTVNHDTGLVLEDRVPLHWESAPSPPSYMFMSYD